MVRMCKRNCKTDWLPGWLTAGRVQRAFLTFVCTHMCYSVVVPPYLLSTNTFGGWEVVTTTGPLSRPWPPLHRPKRSRIGWCVEPLWVRSLRCLTRRRKASVSSRGQMQHLFENYHGDGDLYLYIIIHLSCWFDLLVSGVYRQISVIFRLFSFNIYI